MQYSVDYIIRFALAVCLVCALLVAGAAVSLKPLQDANAVLDRQKKVLTVAGLIEEGQSISAAEVARLFEENIRPKVIDRSTGELAPAIAPEDFDQQAAMSDPERSVPAPVIRVKKGSAGPPAKEPHQVDGLSGATLTSRGVTALVQFWLGENGYGPYLSRYQARHVARAVQAGI